MAVRFAMALAPDGPGVHLRRHMPERRDLADIVEILLRRIKAGWVLLRASLVPRNFFGRMLGCTAVRRVLQLSTSEQAGIENPGSCVCAIKQDNPSDATHNTVNCFTSRPASRDYRVIRFELGHDSLAQCFVLRAIRLDGPRDAQWNSGRACPGSVSG